MKRMNFGCGYDNEEGWDNIDKEDYGHNIVDDILDNWIWTDYDVVRAEHVLHMFSPTEHAVALKRLYRTLKPGGILELIEFDPVKVFEAYQRKDAKALVIPDKIAATLDDKLTYLLSYNGLRKSIITKKSMITLLHRAGFSSVVDGDLKSVKRPLESFYLRAIK